MTLQTAARKQQTAESRRDIETMERVKNRDPAAIAELYDRYAGLLVSLADRILHDRQEAEDVLQEVFVQVWRIAERYDSRRSSVSTWLVMLMRCRALDRYRSRSARQRTRDSLRDQVTDTQAAEAEERVWRRELYQRLRDELSKIPAEQRRPIELAYYRGLTQVEIARELGVPLGTVKTRILLGMRKLKQGLRDEIRVLCSAGLEQERLSNAV